MLIVGGNQSAAGYDIDNSLRFNSGSSDYLSRTPASTTNRTTWTWSAWVKRANLSSNIQELFASGLVSGTYNFTRIFFDASDRLVFQHYPDTNSGNLTTTQVFRDPSAWYHIVVVFNSTSSTSSDRMKIYVNGSQVTNFTTGVFPTTYPSQNTNSFVNNSTYSHTIGRSVTGYPTYYYNGYMSEVILIDGAALDPTSFGEFDSDSGIWKPIPFTGSYGTNGFFLEFQNSAALGTDSSGNGNNFTVNNLTSVDQSTDTPTNNFCTLNPLQNGCTLSQGNLQFTSSVSYGKSTATLAVTQGKWYWEVYVADNDSGGVGIANFDSGTITIGNSLGEDTGTLGWVWREPTGVYSLKRINSVSSSYGSLPANGDILGVALDLDAGTLTCYKNNVSQGTLTTGLSGTYTAAVSDETSYGNPDLQFNFGSPPFTIASGNSDANGYGNFEYAPPSGHYALCTKNLAEFG